MQTPRVTRSSVLGKRSHQISSSSPSSSCAHNLLTPDQTPNPKRARVYTTTLDGDSNKENIAPFRVEGIIQSSPVTPRSSRALRRANTDLVTPSRTRAGDSPRFLLFCILTNLEFIPAPQRHASGSDLLTPATASTTASFSHLTLSTPPPTPPTSLLPIHSRVRALLRPTCNATVHIAGRDDERARIQDFLSSFLNAPKGTDCNSTTTLYISGSPGSGKTALVNSILCDFESESTSINVISVNCMALNSIDTLWDRLLEQLEANTRRKSVGRTKKVRGRDAVDTLLAALSTKWLALASFLSLLITD
jgi:cell division control protein 6